MHFINKRRAPNKPRVRINDGSVRPSFNKRPRRLIEKLRYMKGRLPDLVLKKKRGVSEMAYFFCVYNHVAIDVFFVYIANNTTKN